MTREWHVALDLADKLTMRDLDVRCLTSVEDLTAKGVQKLRKARGHQPSDTGEMPQT